MSMFSKSHSHERGSNTAFGLLHIPSLEYGHIEGNLQAKFYNKFVYQQPPQSWTLEPNM